MAKTITQGNKFGVSIQSIHVKNEDAIFSLNVNKQWLFTWARRTAIIGLFIGYIIITIMSYSVSPVYFWTLVKAGVVLSLLSIIALSKN